MIDTHAHIDFEIYDSDLKEVVDRALHNGVEKVIIPGVEPKNFQKILNLTKQYNNIYCGIGVHPHNAAEATGQVFERMESFLDEEKVVAVGETGIDYFYDFAPPVLQQDVFRQHLRMGKAKGLPIIVHNREADDDILRIIKEEQDGTLQGVLHCFSSSVEVMRSAVDLGFHISFTGNITFKKSDLTEVVAETPLERIMLETDSPFMTPVPNRGKRNEPSFVLYVAKKIAEIKSVSLEEVISMTTQNAKKLFKLVLILFTLLALTESGFAQTAKNEETLPAGEEEVSVNPFHRFIGFGPVIGFNTIVQSYDLGNNNVRDISYEGIIAYGAVASYSLFDFCLLQATFIHSKNNKPFEYSSGLIGPSIYNIFELSANWIVNPYSPINFYATTGFGFQFNTIDSTPVTQNCIVAALGFSYNYPTKYGLFSLTAEWKLDFVLNSVNTRYLQKGKEPIIENTQPATMVPFFSIPRVFLMWYPKF
ncbi:MAG: TatD family hydrolase [Bacteroidota bacterium]